MVTRDKDDPRNEEAGERGPGGVRMVVVADIINGTAIDLHGAQMHSPGNPFIEELSRMKVGRAEALKGRGLSELGHQSCRLPLFLLAHPGERTGGQGVFGVVQADQQGAEEVLCSG
jgi:hypothetical protein